MPVLKHRCALAGALGTLIFLGACTPAQQLALNSGVEHGQDAKDTEARLLKASVCAMSIGAYYRVNTMIERRALDVLCGGAEGALASAKTLPEPLQ